VQQEEEHEGVARPAGGPEQQRKGEQVEQDLRGNLGRPERRPDGQAPPGPDADGDQDGDDRHHRTQRQRHPRRMGDADRGQLRDVGDRPQAQDLPQPVGNRQVEDRWRGGRLEVHGIGSRAAHASGRRTESTGSF
jgi:hypothetical protein